VILLTVGTQLPFDRLVRAMDRWAEAHPDIPVWGQIGADRQAYHPTHFEAVPSVPPDALDRRLKAARLVVGHAGTGTLLGALRHRRPIVVMPREAARGEHRNDHQQATAARFEGREGIRVVHHAQELDLAIDALLARIDPLPALPDFAEPSLIDRVRKVVTGSRP
jgi:UDP-N-acetylglucosamine transferase subunit ALG13